MKARQAAILPLFADFNPFNPKSPLCFPPHRLTNRILIDRIGLMNPGLRIGGALRRNTLENPLNFNFDNILIPYLVCGCWLVRHSLGEGDQPARRLIKPGAVDRR